MTSNAFTLERFYRKSTLLTLSLTHSYSPRQLYSLVSDVPSYSSFIPFCTSSNVLAEGSGKRRRTIEWKPNDQPFEVDAELKVGFGGLEERYISKVVGRPFESVTVGLWPGSAHNQATAEQTPLFNSLITTWSFSPASSISPHPTHDTTPSTHHLPNSSKSRSPDDAPTLLTIDLAFSFANPLHRIASQAVLPKVADKMVEAFEKQCLDVWGKQ